jgi:signal transduction histidine kinase
MTHLVPRRTPPWRLAITGVAGLVVGLVAIGIVGLIVNARIGDVVEETLRYDIELEDEADDLRVAILDLDAYHRLILLSDPSPLRAEQLDDHYAVLLEEIGELAAIGRIPAGAPQPDLLRDRVTEYYDDFRPALDAFLAGNLSRAEFDDASDRGLAQLSGLEQAAIELDRVGEALAEEAFATIEEERRTGFLVLGGVIVGLSILAVLVGVGAVLMFREGRRLLTVADEAAQSKDDFIADASHELRTPLTVLRGNAEQALALGRDSPPDLLEDIASEAIRMSRLVDDLLVLARSDAASLPLALERVDAEPLLTEVSARAKPLVREWGGKLSVDVGADGTLQADPARLEQAILILIDNAAKYGRQGGRVELRTELRDGRLRIAVQDDGPGIPAEALPHIFERFYRVDRTRARSSGGAGLGLAIASSIVYAHAGQIEVDSTVGRGTTMTIVLPLAED